MARTSLAALVAACLAAAAPALAQQHGGHAHHAAPAPGDSDATRAYRAAADAMHRDMTAPYTNDVDVDFLRGMIPHHRGAIAMAKVALAHSKDPEIRRLAEGIVRAQEGEIAEMEALLKRHGAR
ncbi:CopM family metallochaperone [Methylobacterium oryzihabitans]|uniref:DUF305 domain-containing protein n=1 Tax=Methylobacterium oryzihabitans TaxID=2499852 RepID=A0A3S2XM45_9HYPH|nr:DUF305 domain-containing protein [Methylobacterium oryzihabitans]RVU18145.1 DUF305 domain-containing protein [Methylobacterium oryzihabitans]